ncbi:hypothetical protein ACH5RR_032201 [Cinchona calisaya]|uniref:MLLE-like domain-containing protein n=1 Tax=Cinchona calisaya TaxID=153742 RepID=A0ABD2YHE5_9GENT
MNMSKKMKLSSAVGGDLDTQFQQTNSIFGFFMEGIQANFTTMATVMANEDKHEQLVLDRSNKVVEELLKLALSQGDVFNAAPIFSTKTSKLNLFFNLPQEMKRQYVINIPYPTSNH